MSEIWEFFTRPYEDIIQVNKTTKCQKVNNNDKILWSSKVSFVFFFVFFLQFCRISQLIVISFLSGWCYYFAGIGLFLLLNPWQDNLILFLIIGKYRLVQATLSWWHVIRLRMWIWIAVYIRTLMGTSVSKFHLTCRKGVLLAVNNSWIYICIQVFLQSSRCIQERWNVLWHSIKKHYQHKENDPWS